jgi:hypothetical protein
MMNISKDDVYAVIRYTGSIFGVDFDPEDIPEDFVQKLLVNSQDFLLTEEIAVIISSHNRIEQALDGFLEKAAPQPKYLKKVARSYGQKIDLCLLLGLDLRYEKPLKVFGKWRNRFAHEPGITLEQLAIDELRESLPDKEQEFIVFLDEILDRIREANASIVVAKKFRDLSGVDQFRVMAMTVWLSLFGYTKHFVEIRQQEYLLGVPAV